MRSNYCQDPVHLTPTPRKSEVRRWRWRWRWAAADVNADGKRLRAIPYHQPVHHHQQHHYQRHRIGKGNENENGNGNENRDPNWGTENKHKGEWWRRDEALSLSLGRAKAQNT